MYNNISLYEWQRMYKPVSELIVQASIKDGTDRSEKFDFSIGMSYLYATLSKEKHRDIQVGKHDKLVLCAMKVTTDMRRRGNAKINRKSIMNIVNGNGIQNVVLHP